MGEDSDWLNQIAAEVKAESMRAYEHLRTYRTPTHAMLAVMTALDVLTRMQNMGPISYYAELVIDARDGGSN